MKKTLLLLLAASFTFADVHYSRLIPFESYNIKAATSGHILDVINEKEGRTVDDEVVVQVDDRVDKIQLQALQTTLEQVKAQIKINNDILVNLQESLKRQEGHYERVASLDTRPQNEKDSAFYNFVSAQNSYLQTKEKISSLIDKEAATKHSIANLKDQIDKKSFNVTGFVNSIEVTKGDYLNPGTLVATLKDTSKAKLELYLSDEELNAKEVYIEDKKFEKGFDKVWKVTDETHISSYKAQIILNEIEDYRFGQLLKVEVK